MNWVSIVLSGLLSDRDIRYPSVTEKFILKDIGGVGAFPNAELKAEQGYNAELGFKQGYKFGNLKGFIDVAGF